MCGLERLFEGADLVTVTPFEFGELGGEGANGSCSGFGLGPGSAAALLTAYWTISG